MSKQKTFLGIAVLMAIGLLASAAMAQPPGFGGGGGRGGGGGGFGGRGGGGGGFGGGGFGGRGGGGGDRGGGGGGASDFRQRMMERMDSNGNGKLEQNEVSDRARGFIEGMVRQAGGTVKYPLEISSITGGGSRGGRTRGRNQDKDDDEFEYPLVAGFGEETTNTAFGLNPNLLNGRTIDIEASYDKRALEQLDRTMERYDKDGNGVLEYEEWRGIPWQSDPRVSDVDKDGRLTRAEMAERYRQTNGGSTRERNSGRTGRTGGGDERGGRGGGERGGGDRGGGRGGGDRGGGGRGGGGPGGGQTGGRGGRGGFDPSAMLQRFDQDGDGVINFDQMDDRVKSFAGRMLERLGMEAKGRVKISDISKKIEAARNGGSTRGNTRGKTEVKETPKSELVEGADQFEGSYSFRQESKRLKGVPRWWEDRDENEDGQVSLGEYFTSRSARERQRQLREFDKLDANGDGILTPSEAEEVDE